MDNEPDAYAQVADELSRGWFDRPLMLRAFAESGGDKAKSEAAYVQYRVQQLRATYQQQLLEARRQEQARVDRERQEAADQRRREKAAEAERRREARSGYMVGTLLVTAFVAVLFLVVGISRNSSSNSYYDTSASVRGLPFTAPHSLTPQMIDPVTPPLATPTPARTPTPAPAPPTPTPIEYDTYKAAIEQTVRRLIESRNGADPSTEADFFSYPLQVGITSRARHTSIDRQGMLKVLRDMRKNGRTLHYTIPGRILAYRIKDDDGPWRASLKVNLQQLAAPHAVAIQDYELIMQPTLERAGPVFHITALEVSDEQ